MPPKVKIEETTTTHQEVTATVEQGFYLGNLRELVEATVGMPDDSALRFITNGNEWMPTSIVATHQKARPPA